MVVSRSWLARAALVSSFAVASALSACGDPEGTADPVDGAIPEDGGVRADGASPDDRLDDARAPQDARPSSDATSSDSGSGEASSDAGDASLVDASADASSDAADASLVDASDASPVSNDPFDPASCSGSALTAADALAKLGASPRMLLASATLMRRTRTCTGATADTCGAFGAPVTHTQSLLTYSGGVTTDYKTFSFPTHLVLFQSAGVAKLSVRHTSDYMHDATASTRGVVFPFGASPMVNTYPIIYVWDFAPAPNRYDDLQGLLGQRAELFASGTCARFVATSGVTTEIAALYRY
jgi:hypothetical protein